MQSRSSLVVRVCVRLCLGLVLLAGLCLALGVQVRPVHAQTTFTVTDCTDDSQLQTDVSTANTDNDGDIITFTCSGDIPLTHTLLISGSMTFDGSQSPHGVTLDGQNSVQVLAVGNVSFTLNALTIAHGSASFTSGGGIVNGGTLTITNSTVSNNSISSGYGGGISNGGTLTITNSTVSNNSESGNASGGGLVNFGTATITNSTFSGNSATEGGGISNEDGGTLTITNSTISNNSASNGGGFANFSTLTISNSTVANNSATNGGGGGLAIFSTNAGPSTVTISNSTFSGNSANFGGGGISNSATLTISNSTFSGNSATNGGGGGISNDAPGTLTISNSTVANNSASIGGGIFMGGSPSPTMSSSGSIVAENTGGDCSNQGGILNDNGYNLDSDSTCFSAGTSLHGNPLLAALGNNGGPTQTMALQQNSPAIDAGPPTGQCPSTDQRGVSRPDDSEPTCDIGAYESNYPPDTDLALTNMPTNMTVNATSPQGAAVTYASPTVVDEDSPLPTANCSPASGSTFAIGTTTVTCTVSDSDDANSPVSAGFSVTVTPVLTASGTSVSATEGHSLSGVVATGTAYVNGSPSASIAWGDGNTSAGSVTLNADGSYSVTGSHTYAEEGNFAITVTVSASGVSNATANSSATVSDAALSANTPTAVIGKKGNVTLSTVFSDADPGGSASDYSATITWGDGSTTSGTISASGASFTATGSHIYAKHKTYTVTVTIKDAGGSSVTKTLTIKV